MRLGLEQARIEVIALAGERRHAHRRQRVRERRQAPRALARQARQRRHQRRAVHDRQALFRLQRQRWQAKRRMHVGCAHAAVFEQRLAFAREQRGDVGQWREITARADRAARRDHRRDAAIEQQRQALDEQRPHARIAGAQRRQPHRHHRAALLVRQLGPHAAAVIARQVARERRRSRRRHGIADRGAEAGVHAVRGDFARQALGNHVRAAAEARAKRRSVGQLQLAAAERDALDRLARERFRADGDDGGFVHGSQDEVSCHELRGSRKRSSRWFSRESQTAPEIREKAARACRIVAVQVRGRAHGRRARAWLGHAPQDRTARRASVAARDREAGDVVRLETARDRQLVTRARRSAPSRIAASSDNPACRSARDTAARRRTRGAAPCTTRAAPSRA